MKKRLMYIVLLVAVAALISAPVAEADHGGKDKGGYGSSKGDGLEGKFCSQARGILKGRDELALTDKQVDQIRALVAETKKGLIKQDADIKTLKVEIDTLMWESPFDVENVNVLIAEKYDLKEKKAKYIVSAHDKLFKLLTKEQQEKANKL
jgi:Spy/CpxP family protein refolding chaperone